jgi:hypothetical protein
MLASHVPEEERDLKEELLSADTERHVTQSGQRIWQV